jgi:hypothetical protein
MNKGLPKVILFACIFIALGFCSIRILSWKQQADQNIRTYYKEQGLVLYEVSNRTGRVFNDWLTLREYVICGDLLKVGMTRDEVYAALSTIGEIRMGDSGAVYLNYYLDMNFDPINLDFGDGYPNRLIHWDGSSTSSEGPRASCE